MRRLLLLVAIAALVAAASGCSSVAARAFRVGSTEVSQSTFDDELALLHDNPIIASSIIQTQLAKFLHGSIPTEVTTRWLTIRIQTTLPQDVLVRSHSRVTAADRAAIGLPTTGPYAGLPKKFRRDLLEMLGSVAAAARALAASDPAVKTRAPKFCPSLRYVSHLLVKTTAEANAIKRILLQGEAFEKLARANSIDTGSAPQGGHLGCLDDLKTLDPAFLAVASAQPIGAVSDPVQTTKGFSLILVSNQPTPSDLQAVAIAVLQDRLRHTDVTIDPRYGRWDRKRLQVVSPSSG